MKKQQEENRSVNFPHACTFHMRFAYEQKFRNIKMLFHVRLKQENMITKMIAYTRVSINNNTYTRKRVMRAFWRRGAGSKGMCVRLWILIGCNDSAFHRRMGTVVLLKTNKNKQKLAMFTDFSAFKVD